MIEYGRGARTFVGLHGWGATHRTSFAEILERIPQDARFIGFELPGYAEAPSPARWDWPSVRSALSDQLGAIKAPGPVTLVGSCAGTYHALDLALAHPDRVGRVVLIEPFAFLPWYFKIFLAPGAGRALYRAVFDNPIGRAATRSGMRRGRGEGDYDMVSAFARGGGMEIAYEYLKLYKELASPHDWAGVRAPVRIIYGAASWGAIRDGVELWRQVWPGLDARAIEGGGHMISHERADEVAAHLFAP